MPQKSDPNNGEIKITNVSPAIKQDLINIAQNQGIDLGALLKPHLRSIRDSYPKDMREKKPED